MSNLKKIQLQSLRGMMLATLLECYPKAALRSMLWYTVQSLCTERELDNEIEYFRVRRWITTESVVLTGRPRLLITLTADGYDIAQGIDPANPILVQD